MSGHKKRAFPKECRHVCDDGKHCKSVNNNNNIVCEDNKNKTNKKTIVLKP
jgi:hypothetical protein